MTDNNRKRHIHKRPEECPEPAPLPETLVQHTTEQQWPHEQPCVTPHEQVLKEKPPAEVCRPEDD